MKIVVTGAQVPFVRGGAELHMENLVGALQTAGHEAELVRLPTAWDRVRIFDAALAWRMVPIDADLVIATNFPSYYVRHHNKIVWLFHQHRAAYDGRGSSWSDFDDSPDAVVAQERLTRWDRVVLEEAVARFTTSGVVAQRLADFNHLSATPLYHPPPLADELHPGRTEPYVFSAMRLEANKRPMPLVEAIAQVEAPTSLRLAGTGSLQTPLRQRAKSLGIANRVDLLGFVDDRDLIEHYANCSAVLYAPQDEDYGYVTLQAYLAYKPVITANDSGGVLEWVEDGVTGYVTDGTPAGIAAAIRRVISDPAGARQMGRAGFERVRNLSWPGVVETLLGAARG
jgi:glycosyltransferase involved in cell wall biosynthesis